MDDLNQMLNSQPFRQAKIRWIFFKKEGDISPIKKGKKIFQLSQKMAKTVSLDWESVDRSSYHHHDGDDWLVRSPSKCHDKLQIGRSGICGNQVDNRLLNERVMQACNPHLWLTRQVNEGLLSKSITRLSWVWLFSADYGFHFKSSLIEATLGSEWKKLDFARPN